MSKIERLSYVYFDSRWLGAHGIGRFAREVNKRLDLPVLNIGGSPASPFDPLRMYIASLRIPKNACIFTPGYNVPICSVTTYLFTLHDLNFIDFPRSGNFAKRLYFQVLVKRAAKFAYRVLTVSQFSRNRIIMWANLYEDKVINVGNGVDTSCFNPRVAPYTPGYPYLLCVSNRKPHKNEKRLIRAFSVSNIRPDIKLVFTGLPNQPITRYCEICGVADRVVFIGKVPEVRMPGLYRGAIALVFPSLYEGFGLPALEAMACGVPVVASKIPALVEVLDGAAILVDPYSIPDIARGIEMVSQASALREYLSARGLERVRMYNWDDVANRIKQVLLGLR